MGSAFPPFVGLTASAANREKFACAAFVFGETLRAILAKVAGRLALPVWVERWALVRVTLVS